MALLTAHDALLIDGDLPNGFTPFVQGIEAVVQRLVLRIAIHRGEWFLDPDAGLPWNAWMSQSMTPGLQSIVEQSMKAEAEALPDISRVDSIVSSWDPTTRELTIIMSLIIQNQALELEFSSNNIRYGNAWPRITQRLSVAGPIRQR